MQAHNYMIMFILAQYTQLLLSVLSVKSFAIRLHKYTQLHNNDKEINNYNVTCMQIIL